MEYLISNIKETLTVDQREIVYDHNDLLKPLLVMLDAEGFVPDLESFFYRNHLVFNSDTYQIRFTCVDVRHGVFKVQEVFLYNKEQKFLAAYFEFIEYKYFKHSCLQDYFYYIHVYMGKLLHEFMFSPLPKEDAIYMFNEFMKELNLDNA